MTQFTQRPVGAHFADKTKAYEGEAGAYEHAKDTGDSGASAVSIEESASQSATKVKEQANRSSNMVSLLVIISRITGFFRTSCQAWALGATGIASAYTVANGMPNMLYELVMGGMLITSFLPVYLSVKKRLGKKAAGDYASNLLSIVVILMAVLVVVSLIFARPIIWTQSVGASADFEFDLSVWFFRWFACSIILYALSSIISGVLNAERDYFWSNIAPIFNNVITIASFLIYGFLVERGVQQAAIVLAIGTPLGIAVQVFCQIPALYRHGVRLRLRIDLHDPALRDTLSIGIPTLFYTFAAFPTTAVMSSCALSVTSAGASIAYYARVWYVLPYSVFAIPISVTMFTELSDSLIANDTAAFKDYLADGIRRLLFTLIPCTMFLIVFAPALIAVFTSGKFTAETADLTAHYLQALALALPFYALSTYLQKACSAMMKMGMYAVSICVGAVLQIVICVALTPKWGLYVVPISSTFYYGAVDILTLISIRRTMGPLGLGSIVPSVMRSIGLGLAGSLVGIAILWLLEMFVGPCEGILRGVLYTFAGGVPALCVTFGTATLLGVSDAPFFDAIFSRLLPHRK